MSEINAKFARAVAHAEAVTKSKTADLGKDFKYSYVTLNDVLATCSFACATEGLTFTQHVVSHGADRQQMTTTIIDTTSGELIDFGGPIFPVTGDPQAVGSAITYHRRYSLVMLFALTVNDDDGAQGHRAAVKPNARTEAEIEIRTTISAWSKEDRALFAQNFKIELGYTLAELPESRHGEALAYFKTYNRNTTEGATNGE
tara:strand:- start:486 stop:1088 length:603 start_codon:yes stop_codon:yes gene_type:complete